MGARKEPKQVKGNQQLTVIGDVSGAEIDITPPEHRVWYRQGAAGENEKHYAYFKQYLRMDKPRSAARLARHLRLHQNTLLTYSNRFKWVDRAAAYDDFNNHRELDKLRAEREKRDLEWLERRDVQRQQEWDIAQELLERVRQMLRVPLFKETVHDYLEGLDPAGKIIIKQVITFEPLDWSAVDIARFFDIAGKMARLATGMDTDQKKIRIDVSALTDDELERLANEQ